MHPLPPYARRIEYLESTGTQWIDTGIAVGPNLQLQCAGQYKYRSASMMRGIGSIDGGTTYYSIFILTGSGNNGYNNIQGAYNQASIGIRNLEVPLSFGDWFTAKLTNRTLIVNGTTVSTSSYQIPECSQTIGIFGWTGLTGIVTVSTGGLITSASIWKSNTLVRSFIPCRILDIGYLWDEVEGKFYGNQGTGDFVLGPDVREGIIPTRLNQFGVGRKQEEIKSIEYLESTGTQYIDTGVDMSINGKIWCDYQHSSCPPRSIQSAVQIGQGGKRIVSEGTIYNRFSFGYFISNPQSFGNKSIWPADVQNNINSAENLYRHTIMMDAETGKCGFDGNETTYSNNWESTTPSASFYAFASNNANGVDRFGIMKIFALKMWKSGNLVRDYQPVRIGSTGYLLDKVSGRLFGNSGTGKFTLGQDINIIKIEYLLKPANENAYIDSGILGTDSGTWIFDAKFSNQGSCRFIGFGTTSQTAKVAVGIPGAASTTRIAYNYGSWNDSPYTSITVTDRHTYKYEFAPNSQKFYCDDVLHAGSNKTSVGSYSSTIGIFACKNLDGNPQSVYLARGVYIYSCKLYDGSNNLVRDFIPVRVGASGYLYDKVSKSLFGKLGSGNFECGPDIVPVEYVESTGTQYVDTGVSVSDPSTIMFEVDETIIQPIGFTHQNVASGTWLSRYVTKADSTKLYVNYKNYSNRYIGTTTEMRKTSKYDGSSGYYENGVQITSFTASVGSDSISDKNWFYGAVYDFNINSVDLRNAKAGKVYSLKICVSGTLVRDFVPVRVGTEGALYDKVTDTVFRSATSTPLKAGPEMPAQDIKYII